MAKRLTTAEFIVRAKTVHGERYDYSETEYVGFGRKVSIICRIHGEFSQTASHHVGGSGCPVCGASMAVETRREKYGNGNNYERIKKTNLDRLGVENPFQSEEIKDKIRQTCIERYGIELSIQSGTVQDKISHTLKNKYGVENPFQSEEIKDKIRQTCRDRYGVDWPGKSAKTIKARKETCLLKYGVEYSFQSPLVKDKIRITCIDRYGESSFSRTDEFSKRVKETKALRYRDDKYNNLDKNRQTCLERYGVEFASQSHLKEIEFIYDADWLIKNYITENKTAQQISNELGQAVSVSTLCRWIRKLRIGTRKKTKFSQGSIEWLEYVSSRDDIYIRHGLNDGEFLIPGTRFHADGFCAENNTIYEFYGDAYHGNPLVYGPDDTPHPFNKGLTTEQLNKIDLIRETIIAKLGYNLVIMWESDWNNFKLVK